VVNADVSHDGPVAPIVLHTSEQPRQVHGAKLKSAANNTYELIVDPSTTTADYRHVEITVDFVESATSSKTAK
jgi:hypothetical protein